MSGEHTTVGAGDHSDFPARMTAALTGDPHTPLVHLGNVEVERVWGRDEIGLPRFSSAGGDAVVNHMDEFAMLVAKPGDHVVLKAAPDPAFLEHLRGLGLPTPHLHVVGATDPRTTVTEDALADSATLDALSALAAHGARITAHGVSEHEQHLAERTGLALAGPDAATVKRVNDKVYSRRVADELGLRQPAGFACDTLADLDEALRRAGEWARDGRRVVVKEGFGVSGKGIAAVPDERRAARLRDIVTRAAHKRGTGRIAFVVEEWVAKDVDLNYQFTITADGVTRFDFVKEQLTEGGVHKGHRFPARLSAAQVDELVSTALLLGKRLHADGYHGVVGVDAMTDFDGGLYPVLEINARNNMSTYQVPLQERFVGPGRVAVARHYPLRLHAPLAFADVAGDLDGLMAVAPGDAGLLPTGFATVNAGRPTAQAPADGRLYGMVVARSAADVDAIDSEVTRRLAARTGDTR